MSDLGRQLARMMRWQGLAFYPVLAVMLAVAALGAFQRTSPWSGLAGLIPPDLELAFLVAMGTAAVVAVLAIAVCWAVTLWHVFWAGQMAFGLWSGLVYACLALVLSPWPGLYVIPHMVRLDVKRLLGVQPDDPKANQANPPGAPSVGGR